MTSPEYQRNRYHAIKNGTWDPVAARKARLTSACRQGHPYVEGSWVWKSDKRGRHRRCLECHNAQQRSDYRRRLELDPDYHLKRIAHNHNTRAKRMGDPNRLSVEDIRWVQARHGCVCLVCGTEDDVTLDHVIPVSVGGLNVKENLQPLCRGHNASKKKKATDYRAEPVMHSEPSRP